MTDRNYSDATFWAISGIGYGKGFDIAEAVRNHDETQARNYREHLAVPVSEVPLIVWERSADGFCLDSRLHWEVDGEYVEADPETEIRAGRNQPDYWWEWVEEDGLNVESL